MVVVCPTKYLYEMKTLRTHLHFGSSHSQGDGEFEPMRGERRISSPVITTIGHTIPIPAITEMIDTQTLEMGGDNLNIHWPQL